MRYLFLILLLCAFSAAAQDGATEKPGIHVPRSEKIQDADAASGRDLFLNPGGRLVVTGFRDYDYLSQERSDSVRIMNAFHMDVDLDEDQTADHTAIFDRRLAQFNMQLWIGRGGEASLLEILGGFLLQQALQFGYQYARERTRAQSLTEMDYLYLPQGPGVMRTFGEVGMEARLRGEIQSLRVWRDHYESHKNKISPE
ncbi:MAG: hypothetical protein WBQ23_07000 [Bacteroidota bacterium]